MCDFINMEVKCTADKHNDKVGDSDFTAEMVYSAEQEIVISNSEYKCNIDVKSMIDKRNANYTVFGD